MDQDLADLIFNWGSTYMITWLGPGNWSAEHRDTHETLHAATPGELHAKLLGRQPLNATTECEPRDWRHGG